MHRKAPGGLILSISFFAICALLSSSCSARKRLKKQADPDAAAQTDKLDPAFDPNVDVTEASIRGTEFAGIPDLDTILFEYDSASLKDATLAVLKKNAEYLKAHRDLDVLVAGHCDERGTTEYNLSLGQKRAKEVREYYIRLGVSGKSIATISYGEEKPVCAESTEDCWLTNRRAETRIRARTASNGTPKKNTQ